MSLNIKDYNGKKYIINSFKGRKGLILKVKLLKLLNPMLAELKDAKDDVTDNAVLFKALQNLLESSATDDVISLLEELMTCVQGENGVVDFDTEFQKNYVTLYKLAVDVIKENYGDVFQALGMNVG